MFLCAITTAVCPEHKGEAAEASAGPFSAGDSSGAGVEHGEVPDEKWLLNSNFDAWLKELNAIELWDEMQLFWECRSSSLSDVCVAVV